MAFDSAPNLRLAARLAGLALALAAGLAPADIERSRLEAVAADLEGRIEAGKLSGAVVMVAQGGEVLMHKALGWQNVEDRVPMRTDTIFRIFSMTKPVTGTALMMLHDEGRFELDDPVEKHLPELAGMEVLVEAGEDGSWKTEPADHPMTVRELVTHTGGLLYTPPLSQGPIAEAYRDAGIMDLHGTSLADSIPALGDIPLAFQPGSRWEYSIAVDVQGYMVERLSGRPFDEFLEERIFKPLGMDDTRFHVRREDASRFARSYFPRPDGSLARTDTGAFFNPPVFVSGGGGLTSTSGDYMRFAQMHLNGGELDGVRILSEEAVGIMRSNQLPEGVDGINPMLYPGNAFGVDFAVVDDSEAFDGAPEGTHWWWGIAGTWFWIDPANDIAFVGMIQSNDILYSVEVHRAVRRAMYR